MRKGLPVLDRITDLFNLMYNSLLYSDPGIEYIKIQSGYLHIFYLTHDGTIHVYKDKMPNERFITFFHMFGIKYTEHKYTYTFDTADIGKDHNIFKKDAETLIKLRKG